MTEVVAADVAQPKQTYLSHRMTLVWAVVFVVSLIACVLVTSASYEAKIAKLKRHHDNERRRDVVRMLMWFDNSRIQNLSIHAFDDVASLAQITNVDGRTRYTWTFPPPDGEGLGMGWVDVSQAETIVACGYLPFDY